MGYAVYPKWASDEMVKVQDTLPTHACTASQKVALAALEGGRVFCPTNFLISPFAIDNNQALQNLTGRVGSGRVGSYQEVFKSHGSGLVRSISFQISRGGSGRVGPRSSRSSRAGSGHDPRDTDHVTDRATLTRELFGSDPRVGPTYLTRGSNTLKTYCFLPEGLSGADASFR